MKSAGDAIAVYEAQFDPFAGQVRRMKISQARARRPVLIDTLGRSQQHLIDE